MPLRLSKTSVEEAQKVRREVRGRWDRRDVRSRWPLMLGILAFNLGRGVTGKLRRGHT